MGSGNLWALEDKSGNRRQFIREDELFPYFFSINCFKYATIGARKKRLVPKVLKKQKEWV